MLDGLRTSRGLTAVVLARRAQVQDRYRPPVLEAPGARAREARLPIYAIRSVALSELGRESPFAVLVLLVLLAHRNAKTGWCHPSQATLAAITDARPSQVSGAVRLLERRGWLAVRRVPNRQRKGGREAVNGYRTLWPAEVLAAERAVRAGELLPGLVESDDTWQTARGELRVRTAILDIRLLASPELACLGRSGPGLAVYLALLAFAGAKGETTISHHHLSAATRLPCRARSSEGVARCVALGLVERELHPGRANSYRLVTPASVRARIGERPCSEPADRAPEGPGARPAPDEADAAPTPVTWAGGKWRTCPGCGAAYSGDTQDHILGFQGELHCWVIGDQFPPPREQRARWLAEQLLAEMPADARARRRAAEVLDDEVAHVASVIDRHGYRAAFRKLSGALKHGRHVVLSSLRV